MRRCGRGQVDQSEVLDDYYHVISNLWALYSGSKGHIITIKISNNTGLLLITASVKYIK